MGEMTPEQFEKFLMALQQMSGAGGLMGFGGPQVQPSLQRPPNGTPVAPNVGVFQAPVGGPGQSPLVPSFGPQGVMFGGGSPFPVDAGPAQLQNALVGLRDLMNTPIGQQAIAELKKRSGYQP